MRTVETMCNDLLNYVQGMSKQSQLLVATLLVTLIFLMSIYGGMKIGRAAFYLFG